jgi:hypothetical protein
MSTGGNMQRQGGDVPQSGGGNVVGKAPSGKLYQPPKFMGQSGQPDNQSTSRGKGKN